MLVTLTASDPHDDASSTNASSTENPAVETLSFSDPHAGAALLELDALDGGAEKINDELHLSNSSSPAWYLHNKNAMSIYEKERGGHTVVRVR